MVNMGLLGIIAVMGSIYFAIVVMGILLIGLFIIYIGAEGGTGIDSGKPFGPSMTTTFIGCGILLTALIPGGISYMLYNADV